MAARRRRERPGAAAGRASPRREMGLAGPHTEGRARGQAVAERGAAHCRGGLYSIRLYGCSGAACVCGGLLTSHLSTYPESSVCPRQIFAFDDAAPISVEISSQAPPTADTAELVTAVETSTMEDCRFLLALAQTCFYVGRVFFMYGWKDGPIVDQTCVTDLGLYFWVRIMCLFCHLFRILIMGTGQR